MHHQFSQNILLRKTFIIAVAVCLQLSFHPDIKWNKCKSRSKQHQTKCMTEFSWQQYFNLSMAQSIIVLNSFMATVDLWQKQGNKDKEKADLKFLKNNCFVLNFSEQGNEATRKSSSTQSYCSWEQCFAKDKGGKEKKIKKSALFLLPNKISCSICTTGKGASKGSDAISIHSHQLLLIFEHFLFFSSSPTISYSNRKRGYFFRDR